MSQSFFRHRFNVVALVPPALLGVAWQTVSSGGPIRPMDRIESGSAAASSRPFGAANVLGRKAMDRERDLHRTQANATRAGRSSSCREPVPSSS